MNAPAPRLQVLLVEDAIEEVFVLRGFLEKAGSFQVTTAQDGDAAARLIREHRFDLVVTDLNLPGIDGYDLIRLIKAMHPRLSVLAITGYTANHYVEAAYRAGADHVLNKPLDRDEFVKRVMELVGEVAEPAPRQPVVLALGALPGDIEVGCGGTLLARRERGDTLLVLPLNTGSSSDDGSAAERKSAEIMGARIIITEASVSEAHNPDEHQMLLERIVHELKPVLVLIPSLADDDSFRREVHRISRPALGDVPTVLGYETATSTPRTSGPPASWTSLPS